MTVTLTGMKRPARVPTFPVGTTTQDAVPASFGVSTLFSASTLLGASAFGFNPPLAHQGGWDEILMVVAPLAVIGLLLWVANRRVSAQIAAETAAGSSSTGPTSGTGEQSDAPGGDGNR